jgi:hypothetical protein
MKSYLLAILRKIVSVPSSCWHPLVFIEGGLGSQILNVLRFWNLQEVNTGQNVKLDLSYFKYTDRSNLWNWELGRYGIDLNQVARFESKSKLNKYREKFDYLNLNELNSNYWRTIRNKYIDRFSFPRELILEDLNRELKQKNLGDYCAIHIRRGDYLSVASKLVQFDEYLEVTSKIVGLLPQNIVLVSDSPISMQVISEFENILPERKVFTLDNPSLDPYFIHCTLRMAKVLITGNSTFSFSAALLGDDNQVSLSPNQFHSGKNSERYNATFRDAGKFFLWN